MNAPGNFRQKLRRWRGAIIALLLVAGAAMVIAAMWGKGSETSNYITAPVERGDIRTTVNATGTLQAITTVQVGSQISGTISWLGADFNSRVKTGQVIAKLDPATFQSEVDNAQAALQSAEAAVETARTALNQEQANVESARANVEVMRVQRDDARRLAQRNSEIPNIISARDIESSVANAEAANARFQQANAQVEQAQASAASAKAKVDQAVAQAAQARATLNQAKITLARTVITSPIDGIVVSRNVDVGQTVAASLQAPTLFTIANDLTKMQVLASIDEADVGHIKEGQRAIFTVDAFPNEPFNGTILQLRLNSTTTQNVVTYSAVINFENPEEKLRPGMTANVTVPVEHREGVLKIPNAALRFKPQKESAQQSGGGTATAPQQSPNFSGGARQKTGSQTVWVLGQNDKLEPRKIEVGITDGKVSEVTGGDLKEGERIVTSQVESGSPRQQQPTSTPSPFGGRPPAGGGRR